MARPVFGGTGVPRGETLRKPHSPRDPGVGKIPPKPVLDPGGPICISAYRTQKPPKDEEHEE